MYKINEIKSPPPKISPVFTRGTNIVGHSQTTVGASIMAYTNIMARGTSGDNVHLI